MDNNQQLPVTGDSGFRPMNIGFYRYSFLNRGGDRVVVDYANHLAKQGHQVTFYTCLMQTVFTIHQAITVRKLPVSNEIGFLLYPLCNQLNHDYLIFDIIHCSPFLSLRHSKSMLYFAQADDVEYYDNFVLRAIIDLLYRRYFKKSMLSVAVSEALTNTFLSRYNASNCHTVTNGIDQQTFYSEPDSELLCAKGPRKAIFFMARGDHFRKGFDLAMKVFQKISVDVAEVMELWVCGEALSENSFHFPVRQFGVVDDARLRQILSSADIFFYPSRHEGFGLFPLEAMACGCSVVTTFAIPYAKHGENALVARIEDCDTLAKYLLELLHNPATCKRLGQDGMFFAQQNYSSEKSARQFEAVLAGIMKNGN